jgi:UDP-N-acetylmuramoylalanine--D-glutamate ligase
MEEYVTAKQQLFIYQKSDDIAVYYSENPTSLKIVSAGAGWKIPYFDTPGAVVQGSEIVIEGKVVCKVADVKLLGAHNLQNVCAAITAFWQVSQDPAAIHWVVSTFTGLDHRLELVREADGIKYFNDSFASAPEATMAAMDAIKGPKVMIVGGYDRGLELTGLAKAIESHKKDLRQVLLIGKSADRLEDEIKAAGFKKYKKMKTKDMESIVKSAKREAKKGDSVVLSPGFASFDMFKNFEDRGLKYKGAVKEL